MLSEEVVTHVASKYGGQIASLVYVTHTDERHLLVDVTPSHFAADDVPKVGVEGIAKHDAVIELRNDGDLAIAWCDVSDEAEAEVLHSTLTLVRVKMELRIESGVDAVAGEIGMVQVVVVDMDERPEDTVGIKGGVVVGKGRSVGNPIVVIGLVESGGCVGNARRGLEVVQLELRNVGAETVLHNVQVGVCVVVHQYLEMLAAIVVSRIEVGNRDERVGGGGVEARVVTESSREVELESRQTFLVDSESDKQSCTFFRIVMGTKADDMGLR